MSRYSRCLPISLFFTLFAITYIIRTKADDEEEAILREELKNIDTVLKKMKKSVSLLFHNDNFIPSSIYYKRIL